jgi:L-asparaginase
MAVGADKGVLVIYTGGTVGSIHSKRANHEAPLVPGTTIEILKRLGVNSSGNLLYKQVSVPVTVLATSELIDSTNITPEHWVEIALIIEQNYDDFTGFVILHGTYTMAYTASALSFMFNNLSKPVVLTGSQNPIGEIR